MAKQQFNLKIDTQWCIDRLKSQGKISEKDANLAQITARSRDEMHLHPLQWLAKFKFVDVSQPTRVWDLNNLCKWLASEAEIDYFVIDPLKADVSGLTQVMSQEFALRNRILAVEVLDDRIKIGTDQPFDLEWQNGLRNSLKYKDIQVVLLNPEQLSRYLGEYYQVSRAVTSAQGMGAFKAEAGVEALLQLGDVGNSNPDANDQHIVKIVDWILQFAFEQEASDIHLEPRKDIGRVRFRIDGVLHNIYDMPANIMIAVVARIKILGRLNVAEKRKPQDGRLKTRTPRGIETELRLSTLPTAFGEKMVMRIFDPEVLVRSFAQLGFTGQLLQQWQSLTQNTHGIILVTGPTGSGKTTTLYSTLKHLATESVNVCTVEDPIEMLEPSFNQMQANAAIDLGFADGIRALMRQDPDIIMVGEIRDQETANMAIQAALTGHLVLSTLHTNDAPSSLTRLNDLGVQPFLSAATILGVLAQRLVRTLCPHCKTAVPTDVEQWKKLTHPWNSTPPPTVNQAVGCEHCRNTGYKGRVGLYEMMPVSHNLKQLISQGANLDQLRQQSYNEGIQPLRLAGARRIAEGVTSFEEVLRVVPL
ncbi:MULTISPECIES: GspE/PulE family protein [unclassified Acinetobacter]|uniref:GspE/PulE family protein n=1 Tax=unclassified Acinetobacter TaxID=196816 RepID=UPI0035B6C35C